MSKGLGRVERAVLETMQPLGSGAAAFTITELCERVYDGGAACTDIWGQLGRARVVAMRRAVHSLCRRYPQLALAGFAVRTSRWHSGVDVTEGRTLLLYDATSAASVARASERTGQRLALAPPLDKTLH